MNKFLALIFSSGAIVGFSMASLSIITNVLLSKPTSLKSALVWFSVTTGLYTANRLIESDKDAAIDNDISSVVKAHKLNLLIFSLTMLLFGILLAFYKNRYLGLLVIVTILYFTLYTSYPLKTLFKKHGRRLKDYLGVKSLMVGTGLSFIVLSSGHVFHTTHFLALVLLYLRTVLNEAMNTIIYDMKDLDADFINGVNTFPIALGVQKTRYVLHFINGIVAVLTLAGYLIHVFPLYSLGLLISLPYFAFLIEYLVCEPRKKDHLFLQYTLVDGAYIIIAPFVLLFTKF